MSMNNTSKLFSFVDDNPFYKKCSDSSFETLGFKFDNSRGHVVFYFNDSENFGEIIVPKNENDELTWFFEHTIEDELIPSIVLEETPKWFQEAYEDFKTAIEKRDNIRKLFKKKNK